MKSCAGPLHQQLTFGARGRPATEQLTGITVSTLSLSAACSDHSAGSAPTPNNSPLIDTGKVRGQVLPWRRLPGSSDVARHLIFPPTVILSSAHQVDLKLGMIAE